MALIRDIDPALLRRLNRGVGLKSVPNTADLVYQGVKDWYWPPYHSVRDLHNWIVWQRIKRANITRENAVHIANEVVARAETVETGRLYRIWEDTRFMPQVRNALAIGAACAAVGGGVGALVGGVGAVIGAAAGFVIGTVCAPLLALFDYKSLFDDWRNYLDPLTVEERYMHYGMFRRLSVNARTKDEREPYPNWVLIQPGSVVRGGLDNAVFILYQALWERESVPDMPGLRGWGLGAATVEQSPEDQLWRGWCHDHCGSPWLASYLSENVNMTAAEARQRAGVPDVSNMPVPAALRDRLAVKYAL